MCKYRIRKCNCVGGWCVVYRASGMSFEFVELYGTLTECELYIRCN